MHRLDAGRHCRSPWEHNIPKSEPKATPRTATVRERTTYCTKIFAVLLCRDPTVTTTGCSPTATLSGMRKLIWVTPTNPGGMPIKSSVGTATPPTVTVTAAVGLGSLESDVLADGVVPVARLGV